MGQLIFAPMSTRQKILFSALLLWVFHWFFLGDYLQYREVLSTQPVREVQEYFEDYPDGWFLEEVSFEEVKIVKKIGVAREFIQDWPNSEFVSEVEGIRVALWDEEIAFYDEFVSVKNPDARAVSFFGDLLRHMRDHSKSRIVLVLTGEVDLYDFRDFPDYVRNLLDMIYQEDDGRTVSGHILELKTNYSEGSLRSYESIISAAIEESFEGVLRDDFIEVSTIPSFGEPSGDDIQIEVEYRIKNQVDADLPAYPIVWTYSESTNYLMGTQGGFVSYLLGVDIDYRFSFVVPGLEPYTFEESSDPSSSITGFDDVSEAYEIMTKQNFMDFAGKVGSNFGFQ